MGKAKKSLILLQKKQEKLERWLSAKDVYVRLSYFSFVCDKNLYCGAAELSPPPEPYNPDIDPALKGTLDEIRIANAAIEEVVE